MSVYYNEFHPGKAAALRELIRAGLIAPGEVDDRSILDVRPADLAGFRQCHFFAGVGIWSYALRLAGWPDDRPVWTGSAPCQPFSVAGKGLAQDDPRHLAPAWLDLIRECRPERIFGGQVSGAIREGWLDDLQDHAEMDGYAVGSATFPACSIGAPHIRQRLYFGAVTVAQSKSARGRGWGTRPDGPTQLGGSGQAGGVADADDAGSQGRDRVPERAGERAAGAHGLAGGLADAIGDERGQVGSERGGRGGRGGAQGLDERSGDGGTVCGLADADGRLAGDGDIQPGWQHGQQPQDGGAVRGRSGGARPDAAGVLERPGPTNGFWRAADWIFCRDGNWRPVKSSDERVADGPASGVLRGDHPRPLFSPISTDEKARVLRLHCYGDGIVAQQAAAFIKAFDLASSDIRGAAAAAAGPRPAAASRAFPPCGLPGASASGIFSGEGTGVLTARALLRAAAQDARATERAVVEARRGALRVTRWRVMAQAVELGLSPRVVAQALRCDRTSVAYGARRAREIGDA